MTWIKCSDIRSVQPVPTVGVSEKRTYGEVTCSTSPGWMKQSQSTRRQGWRLSEGLCRVGHSGKGIAMLPIVFPFSRPEAHSISGRSRVNVMHRDHVLYLSLPAHLARPNSDLEPPTTTISAMSDANGGDTYLLPCEKKVLRIQICILPMSALTFFKTSRLVREGHTVTCPRLLLLQER